ncbi:MAG: orotidine-5'-phosphate decarboxylase [bacterium]
MKQRQEEQTFAKKLQELQTLKKSLLCVGIDPEYERLPKRFADDKDWLFKFCYMMIKSTMQYAVAYKFNFAFFESLGAFGSETLNRLLEVVPTDCISLADAKRGDIGNSARHYAKAIFENFGFDAVTVNPYMGYDAVEPFLAYKQKGAFCLCLTSNPGAKDLQYCQTGGKPLYLHVANLIKKWNQHGNCGMVVGATKPAQLKEIREMYPDMPFLIPGVGAQGGNLDTVLETVGNTNALIAASRSIIYASAKDNFAQAAAHEAATMQAKMAKYF